MDSNEKKSKRPRIGEMRTGTDSLENNQPISSNTNPGNAETQDFRQEGYHPRQSNGYNRYNQGGYNNRYNNHQGNYQPRVNYTPRPRPEGAEDNEGTIENAEGTTGYQPRYQNNGYNNRQGGYNNRQGAYNNRQQGAYNNNRPGGYNPQRGYNNNRNQQGGYNNRQGGYTNHKRHGE
ncbi:MAG: pseudouridine synthase, partial [Paramuribaculum sp.]|nr:pseudouridine synthase [Paramuribaculum sp.]